MAIYITVEKLKEDVDNIFFKFTTDTPDGMQSGYCIFNKVNKSIELNKEKSHSYFLGNPQIKIRIGMKIIKLLREGEPLPNFIEIVS